MISNVNKLKKYSCLREWVQIRQNYFGHWSRLEISSTWRFRQKQCNQFATMQILIFDNESFFSHIFFPQPTWWSLLAKPLNTGPLPAPTPLALPSTSANIDWAKTWRHLTSAAENISSCGLSRLCWALSTGEVMERHFATSISLIALGQRPALYSHTQTQTHSLSLTHTHTHAHTPLEGVKLFPSVGCHDPPHPPTPTPLPPRRETARRGAPKLQHLHKPFQNKSMQ